MSEYYPDVWVLLRIDEGLKVLGGWSGGYLDGDSWRLSSGVIGAVFEDTNGVRIHNHSGSVYFCGERYGSSMATIGALDMIKRSCLRVGKEFKELNKEEAYQELIQYRF